jgi:hypothetical protein
MVNKEVVKNKFKKKNNVDFVVTGPALALLERLDIDLDAFHDWYFGNGRNIITENDVCVYVRSGGA